MGGWCWEIWIKHDVHTTCDRYDKVLPTTTWNQSLRTLILTQQLVTVAYNIHLSLLTLLLKF